MSEGLLYCITCNCCNKPLDATGIRTKCNHLMCLQCANEYFTSGSTCPCCKETLSAQDLCEVLIGIPSTPVRQCMLQSVLQYKDWESIVDQASHIRNCANEVLGFVEKQLLFAGQYDFRKRSGLQNHLEESKSDMV